MEGGERGSKKTWSKRVKKKVVRVILCKDENTWSLVRHVRGVESEMKDDYMKTSD